MYQFTFTSRVHKGSLLSTSCQHLLTLVFLMMAIPIDVRCHLTGISIYIALVISRRRQWHPTPVLLPGKSHGRRSLAGCSPWGREESDTTEQLHFPFSLSCTGEGNGNPLQCSCLENPRDREPGGLPSMGSQSQRRLRQLSSSSNSD